MDINEFRQHTSGIAPLDSWSMALQALWYDAKGDWQKAHACAQAQEDADGSWVHAYLHRKEGDLSNAAHWYRRAVKPVASGSLEDEWETLVVTLLARETPPTL